MTRAEDVKAALAKTIETFARLEAAGVEIKERPRFAVHSEMLNRISFVRDPDGIIVELAERSQNRLG